MTFRLFQRLAIGRLVGGTLLFLQLAVGGLDLGLTPVLLAGLDGALQRAHANRALPRRSSHAAERPGAAAARCRARSARAPSPPSPGAAGSARSGAAGVTARFLRTSTVTVLVRPCGKLCRTWPASTGRFSSSLPPRPRLSGRLVSASFCRSFHSFSFQNILHIDRHDRREIRRADPTPATTPRRACRRASAA